MRKLDLKWWKENPKKWPFEEDIAHLRPNHDSYFCDHLLGCWFETYISYLMGWVLGSWTRKFSNK